MMTSIPASSPSLSPHSHHPAKHTSACYSPMQSPRTSLSPSPQKPLLGPSNPALPSSSRRRQQQEQPEQNLPYQRQPLKDASMLSNQPSHQRSSGATAKPRSSGQTGRKVSGYAATANESAAWTRRTRQQTEHSSADEEEEVAPPLESPTSENGSEVTENPLDVPRGTNASRQQQQQQTRAAQTASSVPQKRTSQTGSSSTSGGVGIGFVEPKSTMSGIPRPRPSMHPAAEGSSRGLSTAADDDLEGHFAQVSMTPPVNFTKTIAADLRFGAVMSRAASQSTAEDEQAAPYSSAMNKMTRTSAFGPFSPLSDQSEKPRERDQSEQGEGGSGVGLKRTFRLHGSLAPPPTRATRKFGSINEGDSESSEASADERSFDGQSPSVHAAKQRQGQRHVRSKTIESSLDVPSVAQRRGKTPTFLKTRRADEADVPTRVGTPAMELDSDTDVGAPPSPTPMGSSDGSLGSRLKPDFSMPVATSNGFLQPGPLSWKAALQRRGSAGGIEPTQRGSKTSFSSSASGMSTSSSAGQSFTRQDASPAVMITRPSRHGASLSTSSASSSSSHSFHLPSMKLGKTTISSSSSPHKAKRRLTAADKGTRMRASISHEEQLDNSSHAVNQSFRFPSESSSPGSLPREPHTSGRRSSTSQRGGGRMDRLIAARTLTSSDASGTPSKVGNSLHDDSGLGLSFTSTEDQADTPFRRGGKFLTAGFDDTPEKGLLGGTTGGTGSLVFGASPARTRKSTSCDSLSGTPARPKPASVNHRGPFNPFGPIQRSSLANQAVLTPGGVDSGPSSPECGASQRTISVPEGLASMEAGEPYSTPQNFKNIMPLQTAFMSTGLVSKRTRGVATADGELLPLPPRPNFATTVAVAAASAATSTMPPPSMAAAMGLKEVVAAAVRRASLGGMTVGSGGQQGPSVMPDTPMKKLPVGGLAQQLKGGAVGSSAIGGTATNRQPPPSVLRPTASSRPFFGNFSMAPPPSSLSASSSLTVPSLSPGRDSASSGGESPTLGDTCDSPTMNLVSVSGSGGDLKNGQDWPRFSSLPRQEEDVSPDMLPTPSLSISPSTRTFITSLPARPSDNNYLSVSKNTAQAPLLVSSRQPMRRTRTNAILPSSTASTAMHPKADAAKTASKPGNRPTMGRSYSEQVGGPRPRSRLGMLQGSDASEGEEASGGGLIPGRPAFSRNFSRPALGLQRKASFGVSGDGTFPMATPTTGLFPIPSTPTRAGGPIKWFEAARLGTTPSPPRRQAKDSLRYTAGGSKSKGKGSASGLPKDTSLVATPTASKHGEIGRFQANFTQLAVLGSGEFSEAVKVEDKSSGEVSAVKRMKRRFVGPRDRLRHLEEVDILRHLGGHANVISLVDAWEEDSHLFIQTELCPLGTLSFFLEGYGYLVGTLDEPRLWKVLAELSSGLQHIHSHGVLHLDLKPANIFVTEIGSLKIGDFGLASRWPTVEPAVILSSARVGPTDPIAAGLPPPAASSVNSLDPNATRKHRRGSKVCNLEREGDREYLAPEIISQAQYSKAADIFSLGLIMVEAVGNVVMPDNGEPWQKLRNDDLSDVDFSMISVSLFRLIRSMLSSHPHKRPSVDEILQHPVLAAVQQKMKEGLRASELDQLPDFDLPRTRSGLSTIHSSSSLGSAIDDALEDDSGDGGGGSDLADLADRSSSSIAAQVAPDTPALSIRGALIQEDELFLCTVLAHDPDPEAREFAVNEWTGDSSGEMLENWQEEEASGRGHGHGHGGRYGYGFMGGAGADDSAVLRLHFADETLAEEDEEEQGGYRGARRGEEDFSMDLDEDEDADAFS